MNCTTNEINETLQPNHSDKNEEIKEKTRERESDLRAVLVEADKQCVAVVFGITKLVHRSDRTVHVSAQPVESADARNGESGANNFDKKKKESESL